MMIGRKQKTSHEQFKELSEVSESLVSVVHGERLFDQAVAEVAEAARGKSAAFAWSGGKDSLVLELICRAAGVGRCVLVVCDLEYPAFTSWVEDHRPDGLTIFNTGQGLDWLKANPRMLFPLDAATSGRWFSMVQHTGQDTYARTEKLDVMFFGRRRQDGNWIGPGPGGTHVKEGVVRSCPIRDWSHADVFAFLRRAGVALPPFYDWPRGYRVGTGPWAKRRGPTREQCWQEVFQIDPSIVHQAADYGLQSAVEFRRGIVGG